MDISPLTLIGQLISLALILAVIVTLLVIPFILIRQRRELAEIRRTVNLLARQNTLNRNAKNTSSKPTESAGQFN